MSWLLNLYETYNANTGYVGEIAKNAYDREYTLLPISHTTQNAHIEVNITEDGNFHSADVIDKEDASTLIPCTDESASRAGSKVAPYPLHDKLSYVAGDFVAYGGKIKQEEPFQKYISKLKNWAESPYSHKKVKSIYNYLRKKHFIKDLVAHKVLYLNEDSKLIEKWDKKYESLHGGKPQIFSVVNGGQESAFIRFNVYSSDKLLEKVWKDKEMFQSFINYYNGSLHKSDLCFVTGKVMPSTDRHANKIRHAADKAKLISANDSSGFTFRGRFQKGEDVAAISYDVSQKAHNALKWLINRQGKMVDQRVFLVWANDGTELAEPTAGTVDLRLLKKVAMVDEKKSYTSQVFAKEVAKAIDGYKNDLTTESDVNILILDSATTGRLAVLYYRNMNKKLYLDRLANWHATCVWQHCYRKDEDKKNILFHGAPSTKDIAFAAYGSKVNEKVVKGLMERILPCIVDGRKIPRDIVTSAFYRASNPVSMEPWEWEKTFSITCALINKTLNEKGEGYNVPLDKENTDRDYLFGRLLAIADVLERRALGKETTRATNAIRYMNSFSKHPQRTWKTIQDSLQPYQARLGTSAIDLTKLIDEVASKFKLEDFNNRPLSGKYLLGLYSQRNDLYQKKGTNKESSNEKGDI
ncbi:type I-C CRISPR-associated protein Cas8c/Csd1 [Virgibacillus sp. M23]|uniref:type I-C CRISPR-associated protein Cas8c/Csd1 n=1 Tax=Virgibacillus sp. M23 TaxID=3079030 RepID=UPI002A9160BC|nr:type I-C CRISPR-associated protein Cas8c/Csd1 [Virgibacillus sp. M23]MDY7044784.1 type I-C CRISPR-associated protein Cas8c/Csd1 [Virgibacillus sp. M23]